jgi:hypothetical protein
MFEGQFRVSQTGADNGLRRHFGGFFNKIKVRLPIERKDSILHKLSAEK